MFNKDCQERYNFIHDTSIKFIRGNQISKRANHIIWKEKLRGVILELLESHQNAIPFKEGVEL